MQRQCRSQRSCETSARLWNPPFQTCLTAHLLQDNGVSVAVSHWLGFILYLSNLCRPISDISLPKVELEVDSHFVDFSFFTFRHRGLNLTPFISTCMSGYAFLIIPFYEYYRSM